MLMLPCLLCAQGGAAGAPVKLVVHVKDERGKRIKEGGEEVTVRVQAPPGMAANEGCNFLNSLWRRALSCNAYSLRRHSVGTGVGLIPVEVTDNSDGTYTAFYTPPVKGNYSLVVEVR